MVACQESGGALPVYDGDGDAMAVPLDVPHFLRQLVR